LPVLSPHYIPAITRDDITGEETFMQAFRILLLIILILIISYTVVTVSRHGLNLLPVFFGDIKEMAWPGQFNFDFLGYLILSALWTAWRERFNAKGFIL